MRILSYVLPKIRNLPKIFPRCLGIEDTQHLVCSKTCTWQAVYDELSLGNELKLWFNTAESPVNASSSSYSHVAYQPQHHTLMLY